MATVEKKVATVGEFVSWILETEIPEAKEWVEESKKGIPPKLWEEFCRFGPTENTLENVAYNIARKIPHYLIGLAGEALEQAKKNIRAFLVEICDKASALDEEISLDLPYYFKLAGVELK